MRIAHCVRSLNPADGGLPAIAQRLASAQSRLGHRAVLITHDSPNDARDYLAYGTSASLEPTQHRTFPRMSAARMLAIKPDHLQVLDDIHFLHLHGVWDPILSCVAAAARQRGIPYVVAPQGMLDPWSLRQKAIKKQLALVLHYRRMLEKAAFVQALHEDEGHFAKSVAPRCRTEILPNGVCLEEISLSHQSDGGVDYFESRFQWPGSKTVLFLGRLHHKKGLDVLAEAFALLVQRHSDARLVVAGPDEGAKACFERQIDELGIASKVALPGPIYGAERYSALRSAACFALPSRQEGFSIAVLEALACETPVVITPACHFPEVEAATAGVIAESPAEHAAAFETYLQDPHIRRESGEAGRRLIEARFEWPAIARSSIELYKRHVIPLLC